MALDPWPAAEVDVDWALLDELLWGQFPSLARLPRTFVAEGWDNVLWRIGNDLVARLPRRAVAAELVGAEHRWLPILQSRLPLRIPSPLREGRPSARYPWPWTICKWTEGVTAAEVTLGLEAATKLGHFLAALHQPAPPDAPANPWRGVPLDVRDERTRRSIDAIAGHVDAPALIEAWEEALALPPWDGPPLWLHGDLHPLNIIVDRRSRSGPWIVAVIDWGDLTSGDPACDLAIGWSLFDPAERDSLLQAAGCDEPTRARARGWAIAMGAVYVASSADHPLLRSIGTKMLDAVLADG